MSGEKPISARGLKARLAGGAPALVTPVKRYTAPGVYVEESPQAHWIELLPTEIALFVGQTSRPRPTDSEYSPLLHSIADFAQQHGPAAPGDAAAAMLQDAVQAYFASGGRALRIAPVASPDLAGLLGALEASAGLADVATVAAPGAWWLAGADPLAVGRALLAHVALPASRRFAIIDPPAGSDVAAISAWRGQFDSADAALYYPWIVAPDAGGALTAQPPSGFVAGIYAAVDRTRGLFKAPVNEIVPTATGLAAVLNQNQQDALNPLGINCIVQQPARGIRVWGARTLSSDSEWKYVNVRRPIRWMARSIEGGLDWVVFEPNSEPIWSRVTQAVEALLYDRWREGALLGTKPEQAYFVRCDRSTMTQADIDAGRLVCQIGIAPIRPAEFVILRIVARTADSSSN